MKQQLKAITPQKRLEVLALYTLALQHSRKAQEFERGISVALGSKERINDHFSDAIYGYDGEDDVDVVLKRAGYVVRKPAKTTKKASK